MIYVICFFVGILLGMAIQYVISRKAPTKIFSSVKPFKQFDDQVYFVEPVSRKEAFNESDSIDEFINKIKY